MLTQDTPQYQCVHTDFHVERDFFFFNLSFSLYSCCRLKLNS